MAYHAFIRFLSSGAKMTIAFAMCVLGVVTLYAGENEKQEGEKQYVKLCYYNKVENRLDPFMIGTPVNDIIDESEIEQFKAQGQRELPMNSIGKAAQKPLSFVVVKRDNGEGGGSFRFMLRDCGVFMEETCVFSGKTPTVLLRGECWFIAFAPSGLEYPAGKPLEDSLKRQPIQLPADADKSSAMAILARALDKTSGTSFSCDFLVPEILSHFNAVSGRYHQLVADDGLIYRKIELFNEIGDVIISMIGNRDGFFYEYEGKWYQVLEILPLWHFDNMLEWFSTEELSLCDFSISETSIEGRKCMEVSVATTKDVKRLFKESKGDLSLDWFTESGSDDLNSDFYKSRPMLRKFTIGADDGLMHSRKHYNVRNQCIYSCGLENVDLKPRFGAEFFKSGKTDGKMRYEILDAYDRTRQSMMKNLREGKKAANKDYSKVIVWCIVLFLLADVAAVLSYMRFRGRVNHS